MRIERERELTWLLGGPVSVPDEFIDELLPDGLVVGDVLLDLLVAGLVPHAAREAAVFRHVADDTLVLVFFVGFCAFSAGNLRKRLESTKNAREEENIPQVGGDPPYIPRSGGWRRRARNKTPRPSERWGQCRRTRPTR